MQTSRGAGGRGRGRGPGRGNGALNRAHAGLPAARARAPAPPSAAKADFSIAGAEARAVDAFFENATARGAGGAPGAAGGFEAQVGERLERAFPGGEAARVAASWRMAQAGESLRVDHGPQVGRQEVRPALVAPLSRPRPLPKPGFCPSPGQNPHEPLTAGTDRVRPSRRASSSRQASAALLGLTAKPWWEVEDLPWLGRLEEHAAEIRDELAAAQGSAALQAGNNVWSSAARGEAVAYGPQWKT